MTPEARAKAIAELEALEANPPTVALTPEEIAQLEQEKRELVEAIPPRRSDAGRIRGEGSAIETGPVAAPASMRARAEQVRALVPLPVQRFDPPWAEAGTRPQYTHGGLAAQSRKLGNVDAAVLARLVEAAKSAAVLAEQARAYVEHADAEAVETRAALDEYMAECGLR